MYQYFLAPIIGYLIGATPFAYIIVRIKSKEKAEEIRKGLITTQKTIDLIGPAAGLIKGALDITKGFLSAFLVGYVFFPNVLNFYLIITLASLGAVIGHCWQICIPVPLSLLPASSRGNCWRSRCGAFQVRFAYLLSVEEVPVRSFSAFLVEI